MKNDKYLFGLLLTIILSIVSSCTKTVIVDQPAPPDANVVEGYIENGKPPYVILTKNSAFFGGINLNDLSAYFIHGAFVKVWDGADTVLLNEFCFNGLPDTLKRQVAKSLGYNFSDTLQNIPNICIYTIPNILNYYTGDTLSIFKGKVGHTYNLEVNIGGTKLTSHTYIPGLVPIALSQKPRNHGTGDSLATVYVSFTDPDTSGNFVRYFTKRNSENTYPASAGSVYDDNLVNGQYVTFPAVRGEDPNTSVDQNTFGYFWKGDTVTVKWAQIDKASYDFWHSLENDGGDSPFSSPVVVKTNIKGGLGIWCGYGATYSNIIIPK